MPEFPGQAALSPRPITPPRTLPTQISAEEPGRGFFNGLLTSSTFAQCWTLDATGNWSGFRQADTDATGWDLIQSRSANDVNEITGIMNSLGSAWVQPAYSPAGNMTTMPQPKDPTKGYTATYDAWNRLVKIIDNTMANTVSEFAYDGATRQILQKNYDSGILTETRHLYYTDPTTWRCLEERLGTTPDTAPPDRQFVWGESYIDDLILRDRAVTSSSSSSSSDGGPNHLGERLFTCHDANWNVGCTIAQGGSAIIRISYTAYGDSEALSDDFSHTVPTNYFEYTYCSYRTGRFELLYFVRNRVFLSHCAVWCSRDPARGVRIVDELYAYCSSRPTVCIDPLGLYGFDSWPLVIPYEPPVGAADPEYCSFFQYQSCCTLNQTAAAERACATKNKSLYGCSYDGTSRIIYFQCEANKKWTCTCKCSVTKVKDAPPGCTCPDSLSGSGTDNQRGVACDKACQDAKNKAPRGSQAKHCDNRCPGKKCKKS